MPRKGGHLSASAAAKLLSPKGKSDSEQKKPGSASKTPKIGEVDSPHPAPPLTPRDEMEKFKFADEIEPPQDGSRLKDLEMVAMRGLRSISLEEMREKLELYSKGPIDAKTREGLWYETAGSFLLDLDSELDEIVNKILAHTISNARELANTNYQNLPTIEHLKRDKAYVVARLCFHYSDLYIAALKMIADRIEGKELPALNLTEFYAFEEKFKSRPNLKLQIELCLSLYKEIIFSRIPQDKQGKILHPFQESEIAQAVLIAAKRNKSFNDDKRYFDIRQCESSWGWIVDIRKALTKKELLELNNDQLDKKCQEDLQDCANAMRRIRSRMAISGEITFDSLVDKTLSVSRRESEAVKGPLNGSEVENDDDDYGDGKEDDVFLEHESDDDVLAEGDDEFLTPLPLDYEVRGLTGLPPQLPNFEDPSPRPAGVSGEPVVDPKELQQKK